MPSASSPFFVPRSTPRGQPSIRSIIKTREKEDVNKLVARCFLWSDIPFNIANNPFYHSTFEATTIVGQGCNGPSYNDLRVHLLQGEKANCIQRLVEPRNQGRPSGALLCPMVGQMGSAGSFSISWLIVPGDNVYQIY
jgi:hypothetical protein